MTELPAVSEEEFRKVCDFLYRRTGMLFTEVKRYYVQRRIAERLASLGISTFTTYFAYLRSDADGEIEKFINAFTVNETYFYREEHQLACLTSDLLAARVRTNARGAQIRIWSVPCSTGEEPYSIAIWLLENWPLVDQYEIEIIGSDIDTAAIELARLGEYGRRALMRLPAELVDKYFSAGPNETWTIAEELRESVRFTPANLVERSQTKPHGKFDVIFCRNVLIYFDDASRRTAAENLYENLAPGAYICLGHTESMSRISPLFDVARFSEAIVYQRPIGEARG